MWHAVAPRLSDRFSLVMPDLPGYGDSTGPAPDAAHWNYSKRAIAEAMIEVMSALGHEQFRVAGHDRGARVAYRLALDHPDTVIQLALLDILPTVEVWERITPETAIDNCHWLLLSQPAPLPEHLIGCDPDFFLRHLFERWAGRGDALDVRAVTEYLRHFRTPSVITAACEDYRAGATVDLELDRTDRMVGRRIVCPTLVLWAKQFLKMSPRPTWERWADHVTDMMLDCGHFIAEEEPAACAGALAAFFASRR
jgi:haloacetate dehalogenase